MSNIRTYRDLLDEKKRLESILVVQRGIIQQDVQQLREELKPALHLISIVGKITSRSMSNPLIALGANLVGELFLKNKLLVGSGKVTRLVIPFLFKNVSTYFLSGAAGGIFQKLTGIWKNRSNGHS